MALTHEETEARILRIREKFKLAADNIDQLDNAQLKKVIKWLLIYCTDIVHIDDGSIEVVSED